MNEDSLSQAQELTIRTANGKAQYMSENASNNAEHPERYDLIQLYNDILKSLNLEGVSPLVLTSLKSFQQMGHLLNEKGIQVNHYQLTPQQLRRLRSPFLLQDDAQNLFCVQKLGKTQWNIIHNGEEKSIPLEVISTAKQWNVYLLDQHKKVSPTKSAWSSFRQFGLTQTFQLLMKNPGATAQMLTTSLLIQLFTLGMPIFYMVIFDRVFGRQNLDTLDIMAVGLVMVISFDTIVRTMRNYTLAQLVIWVDKIRTHHYLDTLFSLPVLELSKEKLRAYPQQLAKLSQLNEYVISLGFVYSLDMIFSVVVIAFLMCLHLQLAIISLLPVIPLAFMAWYIAPRIKEKSFATNQEHNKVQTTLSESLDHWETLLSFGTTQQAKNKVLASAFESCDKSFSTRFDNMNNHNWTGLIIALGSLATLYYGAHGVLKGEISYGAYAAINIMSRNVTQTCQRLIAALARFEEVQGIIEGFDKDFCAEAEIASNTKITPIHIPFASGKIDFQDVSFSYPNSSRLVLDNLNLSIQPGEKIVLTGQPSSGKTTVLRLVQGLFSPTSGVVTLDGFRSSLIDEADRSHIVGVGHQKTSLFSGSLLDNITLGRSNLTDQQIWDVIYLLKLDKFINQLPLGFDTPIQNISHLLNSDLLARVILSRALVHRPTVLLIDNVFDAIHPEVQAAFVSQYLQANPDITAVFVSQYLPLHQQVNKIAVIQNGTITESGHFNTLVQRQGAYYYLHVIDRTFKAHAANAAL